MLNPGAWLFLGTAASSLLSAAAHHGNMGRALLAALAMVAGLTLGDGTVVLLGGIGIRRTGERAGRWVRRALATVLAALGPWLLVTGAVG